MPGRCIRDSFIMKVVFYRHSLLNRGGDKIIITYANYLAQRGHKVNIYTNTVRTVFKISSKVKILKIPLSSKLGTILWGLNHSFKADIIIADIIVLALILSFRNKNKVVYFAQDYDVFYYSDKLRQTLLRLIYWIALKILRLPCIAVSHSLKRELMPYTDFIEIVTNGVNLNVFYYDPDPNLLHKKEDRKAILIFARKEYRKGFDIALRVISSLIREVKLKKLEIWAIGDPIPRELLPYKIRNFGYVKEEKLRKLLSSVDVLFYPSRHEGLPLLVLEALACKCPVVTTNVVNFISKAGIIFISNVNDEKDLKSNLIKIINSNTQHIRKCDFSFIKKFDLDSQKAKFEICLNKFYLLGK